MKKVIVCLLVAAMLIQIGCSSITQIPYPVNKSKSENEIGQLNYFGDRLNSKIYLTNSAEIEAYWLKMKENKIYFLTEGLDDTSSVEFDKVNAVKFYDGYGGCMKGGWLGLGLTGLATLLLYIAIDTPSEAGYAIVVGGPILIALSTVLGVFFLGEREFNIVQSKSTIE